MSELRSLHQFLRRLARMLWLVSIKPLASFVFVVFLELPLALCLFAWWWLDEQWEVSR